MGKDGETGRPFGRSGLPVSVPCPPRCTPATIAHRRAIRSSFGAEPLSAVLLDHGGCASARAAATSSVSGRLRRRRRPTCCASASLGCGPCRLRDRPGPPPVATRGAVRCDPGHKRRLKSPCPSRLCYRRRRTPSGSLHPSASSAPDVGSACRRIRRWAPCPRSDCARKRMTHALRPRF